MTNITQFPVVPRLRSIEGGKGKPRDEAQNKRARNMATNVQIAMRTVAERAPELKPAEAAEVARQLDTFHNSALALEALVSGFTDGNGPKGGKAA